MRLAALSVDLEAVRGHLEEAVSKGRVMMALGELPYTSRARKALEYAVAEARDLLAVAQLVDVISDLGVVEIRRIATDLAHDIFAEAAFVSGLSLWTRQQDPRRPLPPVTPQAQLRRLPPEPPAQVDAIAHGRLAARDIDALVSTFVRALRVKARLGRYGIIDDCCGCSFARQQARQLRSR